MSTPTIESVQAQILEPITVSFTVKESTGETICKLDSLSDFTINGAYDALRIKAIAFEAQDAATVGICADIITGSKDRAKEVGKRLVREAGDRAKDALKPGGNAKARAEARAALKSALRTWRLTKA